MNVLYDHPYYRTLLHTSKRAAPYMLEADLDGAEWVYRPHRQLLIVSPTCSDAALAVGLATALAASTHHLGNGPVDSRDDPQDCVVPALGALRDTHRRLKDAP
jgi:hypothetical protein